MSPKPSSERTMGNHLLRIAAGLCRRCGTPRVSGDYLCDGCMAKERERQRARRGSKPWRPGGPGRPPKSTA